MALCRSFRKTYCLNVIVIELLIILVRIANLFEYLIAKLVISGE